jgi:hypothetical protein
LTTGVKALTQLGLLSPPDRRSRLPSMSVQFDLSKKGRANVRAGLGFNIRSSAPALQETLSARDLSSLSRRVTIARRQVQEASHRRVANHLDIGQHSSPVFAITVPAACLTGDSHGQNKQARRGAQEEFETQ